MLGSGCPVIPKRPRYPVVSPDIWWDVGAIDRAYPRLFCPRGNRPNAGELHRWRSEMMPSWPNTSIGHLCYPFEI